MSDYIQQIESIKKTIQSNKEELIRLEEKEKTLKDEKKKLLEELKTYEITEENLNPEIEKLDNKLNKEIKEIEEKLK